MGDDTVTAVVMGAAGLLTGVPGLAVGRQQLTRWPPSMLPVHPVPAVQALLDPWHLVENSGSVGSSAPTPDALAAAVATFRITRLVFSLFAGIAYLGITYALYKSMVRGFDMTDAPAVA